MTMHQWAQSLAKKLIFGTPAPSSWPYAGFYDWFSGTGTGGYLPSLLALNARGGLPPHTGVQGSDYAVNQKYLFLGLNPSRPFFTNPSRSTKAGDPNQRNWINFNLAGEPATEWESWDNVGDLVKSICPSSGFYRSYHPEYRGAYMGDLAPFVVESSGRAAREVIKANVPGHSATFAGEMAEYKTVVHPGRAEFSVLNILVLGQDAWTVASLFLPTLKVTFPGAKLWQCHHYARGWHPELVEELAAIAGSGVGTLPNSLIL